MRSAGGLGFLPRDVGGAHVLDPEASGPAVTASMEGCPVRGMGNLNITVSARLSLERCKGGSLELHARWPAAPAARARARPRFLRGGRTPEPCARFGLPRVSFLDEAYEAVDRLTLALARLEGVDVAADRVRWATGAPGRKVGFVEVASGTAPSPVDQELVDLCTSAISINTLPRNSWSGVKASARLG